MIYLILKTSELKGESLTFLDVLKLPSYRIKKYPLAFLLVLVVVVAATIYPNDPAKQRMETASEGSLKIAHIVEDYIRHVNWVLPIGLALVCRDLTGLYQIASVVVVGTAATHIPKRALNDVVIFDIRLGQRPVSPNSKHNMPSGHSALSSGGAYVLARRYSLWLALIGIPILLLTMYARVTLDAHTISATISGAAIGFTVAAMYSTRMVNFCQKIRLKV